MTSHSCLQTNVYSTRTLLTRLSAFPVTRPEQNTALNGNVRTEQFITANISGNALKQGSRIHSLLHQCILQLQKQQAARMSCRIAVE